MTSCACCSRRAAATDESTPPDIATTILMLVDRAVGGSHARRSTRQIPQLFDNSWKNCHDPVDFGLRVGGPQAEADGILRPMRRKAHGLEHVRRLERAGRTGRPG